MKRDQPPDGETRQVAGLDVLIEGAGDRTYQDGGYTPRYGESVPTGAPYEGAGTTAAEQPGATGTTYPNVTPVGDEAYYPPPVEGDVRR